MNDCKIFENIIAKESGERTVNEELFLQEHSQGCFRCRKLLQSANNINALLESIQVTPASADLSQRIVGRLLQEARWASLKAVASPRISFGWLFGEVSKAVVWGMATVAGLIILGEGLMRLVGYSAQTGTFLSGIMEELLSRVSLPSMNQVIVINILLAVVVLVSAGVLTWKALRA
jgi:predicted anti-sigma-YlaC factor YlaD